MIHNPERILFAWGQDESEGAFEKLKLPEVWWKGGMILDPMTAGFIDGALDVANTGGSLFEYMILRLGGLGALFTPPKYFGQTPGTMMGIQANAMDAPLRTLVKDPGLLLQILPEIKDQIRAWAIETVGLDEQAQYNQGRAVFEIATLFIGVGEIKGALKSGESTYGLTRVLTKVDASSGQFALKVSQAGADIETIESGIKLLSKNGDLLATYSDNVWRPAKWIDQSASVVTGRVDNLAHISPSGARVVGALEVVRNGDEIGVRALRGASGAGKYATSIDNFVTEISKVSLPPSVVETFTDGLYRTVTTNQAVTLYRGFGTPNAYLKGGYATTAKNATRNELAILDEWGNSLRFEAKIEVPKGQTLNIGKVKKQVSSDGLQTLTGGGDQVLLPQNWDYQSWVKIVVDKQTGVSYTYSEFLEAFPKLISQ